MSKGTLPPRTRGVVNWRPAFLTALSEIGVVVRAAKAANISTTSVWLERKNNPEFRAQYDDALQVGALALEDEAVRRARDGVRRIKFNPKTGEPYTDPETGKPYTEHEFSDTLLLALLKRHFSQYHEKPPEVNVATHVHNHVSVERQKELQARMKAAQAR